METTINYTKAGKPVTKTFRSYNAIIRHFQTEIAKLEVKEKALDSKKYPEVRAILQEEKREYERTIDFYKKLLSKTKTIRNDMTGEVNAIEFR